MERDTVSLDSKRVGEIGEDAAVEYLRKEGFKILERNFVWRMEGAPQKAEIDIIAKKGSVIFFVEVKTSIARNNPNWTPEDRVNFWKQQKIKKAAEVWMLKNKISYDTPTQVDIITVLISDDQIPTIRYFPNIG